MSSKPYRYFYVKPMSYENLLGDWEPRVEDTFEALEEDDFENTICNTYTGSKQDVLSLLLEGLNFNEIGKILHMKQSQIYQMKREFMKDFAYLKYNRGSDMSKKMQLIINLITLYYLIHPSIVARKMYEIWETDKVLKEYKKPPYNIVETTIGELSELFKK